MPSEPIYVLDNPAVGYYEEAVAAFAEIFGPPGAASPAPISDINRALRRCTLMSAMAAEAFVNAFLGSALTPDEAWALDRQSTVAKYLIGPRLATRDVALVRGAGPLQVVAELFKRRNAIVHARPRRLRLLDYGLRIDPRACTDSLVAVADCVRHLNDCLHETDFMGPLETVHDLGDEVDVDPQMIDVERKYFFTGGLVHVVAEGRQTLQELADQIRAQPGERVSEPLPDLVAEGRRREQVLTLISPQRE